MTVSLDDGRWVVPTRRAILVQPGQRHSIDIHGRVFLKTIYLQQAVHYKTSRVVVDVHPLMHELIQHVCHRGIVRPDGPRNCTLIRFFEQQLQELRPVDSKLAMPKDERALRFARQILETPTTNKSLAKLAAESGSSLRTIQRLFANELGISVSQWRQRVKMLKAIEYLGQGETVTASAFLLGFEGVSAFVHAFKKHFGVTPGKYRLQ